MQPTEGPDVHLARRLRALRTECWPGRTITQGQLAKALGGGEPLSVPLISSWESLTRPKPPPLRHLDKYALFFATERSVEREPFRLLDLHDLTPVERHNRDLLLDELTELRGAVVTGRTAGQREPDDSANSSLWRFKVDKDITIVCAPLPGEVLECVPYSDPNDPDYVRLSRFADVDALVEIYGYLRAVNPQSKVKFRTSDELRPDDYTSHLVLIGGVDWNTATRDMLLRVEIPVRQTPRDDKDKNYGAFEVHENGRTVSFQPTILPVGDRQVVVEDVAYFYRGPNPYNKKRTVTFLNGMFSRGTLGVVRALTDTRFRDRNEAYVRERFAGSDTFSVLSRVPIVNGRAVTPDWTLSDNRLHEWPEVGSAGSHKSDDDVGPGPGT